MKRLHLHFSVLAVIAALLIPASTFARSKKKTQAAAPQPTVIASVAPGSITISENQMTKTYAITQFTDITVKGQRARLSDLQPGMMVSVTLGTDPTKLSRINAGDAPAPQAPGKK
jgi:hypothetical protein